MNKRELTASAAKVQIYGFLACVAGCFLLIPPFEKVHGEIVKISELPRGVWIFGIVIFLGMGLHELIHGLTAIGYGKIKNSDVKFGFQWKTMTPYFHSKVPISAKKYRVVTIMPLIVMGIIPYTIGMLTGNGWILAFGIAFILSAFGDIFILWLMRKVRPEELVQDHPEKIGLIVLNKEQ